MSSSRAHPQSTGKAPQKPRVYKTNNSLALVNVDEEPIAIQDKMRGYKREYDGLVSELNALINKKNGLNRKTEKTERDKVKSEIVEVQGKVAAVNQRAADWRDGYLKDGAKRDEAKRAAKK